MVSIRVADEVWIATALLHRQHPEQGDFTVGEIVRRADAERVTGAGRLRPGVQVHAYLHCVANKAPNPGRYRMLVETTKGRRRLFRPGDPCHPLRASGKDVPDAREIRRAMGRCSTGIVASTSVREAKLMPIRSSPCAGWAKRSGRKRTPTPT